MKHLILILLLFSSTANAFWPFTSAPDPIPEYKEKIAALETQLSAQSQTVNHWQIATGSLSFVAVLLFVIGTALGATTRKNHDQSRRMGPTPPPTTGINGKPRILRKKDEENVHEALVA